MRTRIKASVGNLTTELQTVFNPMLQTSTPFKSLQVALTRRIVTLLTRCTSGYVEGYAISLKEVPDYVISYKVDFWQKISKSHMTVCTA